MRLYSLYIMLLLLLVSCQKPKHPEVPASFTPAGSLPSLKPDYTDAVIPPNIAPLNFLIDDEQVEECVARFSYKGGSLTFGEKNRVVIDEEDWHAMLRSAIGDKLTVELYARKEGVWTGYPPFSIEVAPDSIDPFIAYRLIPPSYSTYEYLSLCQRNIEGFNEVEIYNNYMLHDVRSGHCINCHAFQNYHTARMQFHVRADYSGTVIYDNGQIKKVNLKRPETLSAAVYPAWHPTLDALAYSMNRSYQNFHTINHGKVEVQDSQAGIMFYDVVNDRVKVVTDTPDHLNAFPTWSPDGRYLYYTSAYFAFKDSAAMAEASSLDIALQHELIDRYPEVHYDVVRRTFDPETFAFGEEEMVWQASADTLSLTVPRISPDGRYLLVSLGNYGVFHVWHPESDLYVADLATLGSDSLKTYPLSAANSDRADSFHNWSSNGRWILFVSRRNDSNYTRLYFSYFDREGNAHKAFELPQRDPGYETLNLRSYNIPEFMVEPIRTTPQELARAVRHSIQ